MLAQRLALDLLCCAGLQPDAARARGKF